MRSKHRVTPVVASSGHLRAPVVAGPASGTNHGVQSVVGRAQAVTSFLLEQGVDRDTIEATGWGEAGTRYLKAFCRGLSARGTADTAEFAGPV